MAPEANSGSCDRPYQDQDIYDPSPECVEVKETCARAAEHLSINNLAVADHVIQNESHSHHHLFPCFHRICAQVHYRIYNASEDPQSKQHRLHESITSARTATLLGPNNIEYSHFYVRLLFHCAQRYSEAAEECTRALKVSQPVDFVVDSDRAETNPNEGLSFRVAYYKRKLRSIRDKIVAAQTIPIEDFKKYCVASVDKKTFDIIFDEALQFAKANRAWRFWDCPEAPGCKGKFRESSAFVQHVLKKHEGEISEDSKLFLPQKVNRDWVDEIANGSWEPIDADDKRTKLIRMIGMMLRMFVNYDYLAATHLDYVLKYVVNDAGAMPSTLCIRGLDASKLSKLVDFLWHLSKACKLGRHAERNASPEHHYDDDDYGKILDGIGNKEAGQKIVLDPSLTKLLLDKHSHPTFEGKESYEAWIKCRSLTEAEGKKILLMLQKELELLRTKCDNKHKFISCASGELGDSVAIKLCIIDAEIMQNLKRIRQLKFKLARIRALDYRPLLVPLLNSYVQFKMSNGQDEEDEDLHAENEDVPAET